MTDQQPTIDFESLEHRGNQRRLIGALAIPPDGVVSAARTKAVLRTIDDYCRGRRGWPSEETIAMQANVGKRTVARAVKRLQELRILAVQKMMSPSGHVQNVYSIVWPELAAIVHAQSSKPLEFDGGKLVETQAERGASQTERSASQAERGASVAPYALRNAKETLTAACVAPRAGPIAVQKKPAAEILEFNSQISNPAISNPSDIAEATAMLVAVGWDAGAARTARQILDRGCTLQQLRLHVATYKANADRLRSPGSIWARVRDGCWPTSGRITDMTDEGMAEAETRRAAREERRRRWEQASTIIHDGLRVRKSESAIREELAARGLTWSDGDPP